MATRRIGQARGLRLGAPIILAAGLCLLPSCSTAPKQREILEQRNQGAKFVDQGNTLFAKGNYSDALSFYRKALETFIATDDDRAVAMTRNAIGRSYAATKLDAEAAEEFGKARDLARRYAFRDVESQALCFSAELEMARGSGERAEAILAEAGPLAAGDDLSLAIYKHDLGVAHKRAARYKEAELCFTEAAALNKKLRRVSEQASAYYMLSSVSLKLGDPVKARDTILKAIEADRSVENSLGLAGDYFALGSISQAEGKNEDALFFYKKSLDIALVVNLVPESLNALGRLIELSRSAGQEDAAKRYEDMRTDIKAISGVDQSP